MKRSVRPLYSILVLIVFFAAFLTCRTTFLGGFVILQIDDHDGNNSGKLVSQPQVPVFNATFVRFAEIDLGEAKTEQDIEQLLEGNFKSQGRYKAFSSWRKRYSTHDEKGRSKSTYSSGRLPSSIRSPEFYRHWLKFRKVLNVWARNRRFQPGIMSDLVALVKNPIDSFSNKTVDSASNKERYKSCAVVGNSGILLKSEYGKLIDSHDFVIRLNIARIGTYQNNVGSKTNLSFVNSNVLHLCARKPGCFCHPYGEDVPMIMYICQPIHLLDYTICNSSHKAPLLITDPRVDVLCSRIVKYYSVKHFAEKTMKPIKEWGSAHDGSMFHYSSGVQAVIVALGICDKVSLFGFGKSVEAKHHYHTDQKAELSLHDYEAEYAFYRDLVEQPKVIPFVSSKFKFPTVIIYH